MKTRDHYVPRFLLRRFTERSINPSKPERLWVCERRAEGRVFASTVNNLAVVKGLYDAPTEITGSPHARLEEHLAVVESDAAESLVAWLREPQGRRGGVPRAVARLLAWQAARSFSMQDLFERWANAPRTGTERLVEDPPVGFDQIRARERSVEMVAPDGATVVVNTVEEVERNQARGLRLRVRPEDFHDFMRLQAWYFEVRHFPRLNWHIADGPEGTTFVTSDRAVAWSVDGDAAPPPSALRRADVLLVAPLSARVALVAAQRGIHVSTEIRPAQINHAVAAMAQRWIAGANQDVVLDAAQVWDGGASFEASPSVG